MDDPPLDVGAVYIPFIEEKWDDCFEEESVASPAIGQYGLTTAHDEITPERAIRWQVDTMRAYGITTCMYNYNGTEKGNERARTILEHPAMAELAMEPFYIISHALKWNQDRDFRTVLEEDCAFMREVFLDRDHVSTLDGRPIVGFWDVNWMIWAGDEVSKDVRDRLMAEFGDWGGLVDFLRSELTIDGTEPYLLGEVRRALSTNRDHFASLDSEFDGLTNWTALPGGVDWATQSEALDLLDRNLAAMAEFATDHDQDVAPMVSPGFDDRPNTCWGGDRYIPRSVSYFEHQLAIAEEHRTVDRLCIATWNDWTEGHQIEPGTFQGEDYGTDYVEAVRSVQADNRA
jgi:hypothetical protein